jgi:hypothetical protein
MGDTYTTITAATAAVGDRIVASATMKNGAYTIANSGQATWGAGFIVTLTHTQAGGVTDSLGTVTIVGTDMAGQAQTSVLTPVTGGTATGTKVFRQVTSATGAGWTRDAGAGSEDTITIGNAAGAYLIVGTGELETLIINTAAAAAITVADARGTIQTIPSNQAAGTAYEYDLGIVGYLKVTTTSTNAITVIHTSSLPQSWS